VPRSARPLHKIRIDQTRRGPTGRGSSALGQRREDAIHSFALQLSENVHAHRITRIKHLRLGRTSRKGGRQHQDCKSRLDHLALHRQRCLTLHKLPRSCSLGSYSLGKMYLGCNTIRFPFLEPHFEGPHSRSLGYGADLIGGTRGATSPGKIAFGRSFQVLPIPSSSDIRFSCQVFPIPSSFFIWKSVLLNFRPKVTPRSGVDRVVG
jgi:hypothetical protein